MQVIRTALDSQNFADVADLESNNLGIHVYIYVQFICLYMS